jgi:hypothetical protein
LKTHLRTHNQLNLTNSLKENFSCQSKIIYRLKNVSSIVEKIVTDEESNAHQIIRKNIELTDTTTSANKINKFYFPELNFDFMQYDLDSIKNDDFEYDQLKSDIKIIFAFP